MATVELTKAELEKVMARVRAKAIKKGKCWIWPSATRGTYPMFQVQGRETNIRRLVYLYHHGKKGAPPHQVRSKCGNHACVSPHCLQMSTIPNNRPDAIRIVVKGK